MVGNELHRQESKTSQTKKKLQTTSAHAGITIATSTLDNEQTNVEIKSQNMGGGGEGGGREVPFPLKNIFGGFWSQRTEGRRRISTSYNISYNISNTSR